MEDAKHRLGNARRLEPDAIGEPGNRRFRLLIEDEEKSACLWLEKEQLQALALAVEQQISPYSVLWPPSGNQPGAPSAAKGFTESPTIEFQVGGLALATDDESSEFALICRDSETEEDGPPSLVCRATRSQMLQLSKAINQLVSAGRPRCPLCAQPIEDGRHHCPSAN